MESVDYTLETDRRMVRKTEKETQYRDTICEWQRSGIVTS